MGAPVSESAPLRTDLTGDDLLDLPTGMGERYELIEGKLVTMTPANFEHGVIALNAGFMLKAYVSQHKIGRVCAAETGFYTRPGKSTVRAPDAAYISYARLPAGPPPADFLRVAPELVVEVVSPGDRAGEIEQKTQEWLKFGVLMVWVVYPESRRVHIYASADPNQPHIRSAEETIEGGDVLPGFQAPISAFFQD